MNMFSGKKTLCKLLALSVIFIIFLVNSSVIASDVYCPKCGTKVESSDVFCRKCGNKMGGSSSSPGTSGSSNLIRGDNWSKEISFKDKERAGENWVKSEEFNSTGVWHVYHKGENSKICVKQKIAVDDITKMEFKCKLQINRRDGSGYLACTYLDESEKELGSSIILCGYDTTYDNMELKNKPYQHIIESTFEAIPWKACRIDFQDEFSTYLYGIESKEVKFIEIRLICTSVYNDRTEIWAGDFDLRYKGGLIK